MSYRGQPVAFGISTLAASKIEYPLPAGVVRFRATGAIDGRAPAGGTVRFVVSAATPETETTAPALPIPVTLADLGFEGRVAVRDLWTHSRVGEFAGTFTPEIRFHGAGLYRLSPQR